MPESLGSRFSPPPLRIDRRVRWLLVRAFAPATTPCEAPGENAVESVLRSGLAPRIASRVPAAVLLTELGSPGEAIVGARKQAVAHLLASEPTLDAISEIAHRRSRRVVLLKGHALNAGGIVAPGSREIGDIDLLVDAEDAVRIHSELQGAGFIAAAGARNEQHLPPLEAPHWGVVDVHDAIRGVNRPGEPWLDASAVLALGTPVEVRPGCWVPDRALLTAHAIAHGLDQHASSPNAFPLLRTLADLIDLQGVDSWEAGRPVLEELLSDTVADVDLVAVRTLCINLQEGAAPEPRTAEGRMLAHLLAHTFDHDYRESLRGRHHRHRIVQAYRRRTLLGYARRKLQDFRRKATLG